MDEVAPTDTFPTDDELAALALSADPHPKIDPRVPPWQPLSTTMAGLLPTWYMPAPSGTQRGTGTRVAIGFIVAGFVLINALGLCVTYGVVSLA